jgi:hypothetical protein
MMNLDFLTLTILKFPAFPVFTILQKHIKQNKMFQYQLCYTDQNAEG